MFSSRDSILIDLICYLPNKIDKRILYRFFHVYILGVEKSV